MKANTTTARPSASEITKCFYAPSGHPSARIKCAAYMRDGEYISYWSGKTLSQMQEEHGQDVQIVNFDWAVQEQENSHKTPVIEITAEQFDNALNCLPPARWVRRGRAESFHMSEMWSGTISCIYVRIAERFFSFRDTIYLTPEEREQKALTFIQANK